MLNPIRFDSIRRNEVGRVIDIGKIRTMAEGRGDGGAIYTAESIQQRSSTILRDVRYVIDAHFELNRAKMSSTDSAEKFQSMFMRRAAKGQCFHHPYFGTREFPAEFQFSKIRNDSTKPTRTTTNRERTMTDRKPIENRYDFTILFEVKDGNPNGDPDSGNMPRVDIETGNGLTTDVCVKRKIRDYVQTVMGEQAPWRIYIQNRQTLNRLDSEALKAEHIDTSLESKDFAKEIKALKKTDPELDQRLRDYMCDQFFDIRTFGAVMTTFVKGSLQFGNELFTAH